MFLTQYLPYQACVMEAPGQRLGVCCMDIEAIVKGVDPELQVTLLQYC